MNQLPDETPFDIPKGSDRTPNNYCPIKTKPELALALRCRLNRLEKLMYDLPYERYKNTVDELDLLLSNLEKVYLSNRPPAHWTPEMQLENAKALLMGRSSPYSEEPPSNSITVLDPTEYDWQKCRVLQNIETGKIEVEIPELKIVKEEKEK